MVMGAVNDNFARPLIATVGVKQIAEFSEKLRQGMEKGFNTVFFSKKAINGKELEYQAHQHQLNMQLERVKEVVNSYEDYSHHYIASGLCEYDVGSVFEQNAKVGKVVSKGGSGNVASGGKNNQSIMFTAKCQPQELH